MHAVTREFTRQLGDPFQISLLLQGMPDIYFYAKDRHGRFVMANDAELDLLGLNSLDELLGRTDADFFENNIAEMYMKEDKEVFEGQSIINKKKSHST